MDQIDQIFKRLNPDSAFEEIYKNVMSVCDELYRSASLSDSDWLLVTILRSDVELLYKFHNHAKTEKSPDV